MDIWGFIILFFLLLYRLENVNIENNFLKKIGLYPAFMNLYSWIYISYIYIVCVDTHTPVL